MRAMTIVEATKAVEQLMFDESVKRGQENLSDVKIELWWDGDLEKAPRCVGVRVAEISFGLKPNGIILAGGYSIMAVEPTALDVIAAVERSIIERMYCTCTPDDWAAEIADADWRLMFNLFKEAA